MVEVGRFGGDGEERVRAAGGWEPAERLRQWPARGNRAASVVTAAGLRDRPEENSQQRRDRDDLEINSGSPSQIFYLCTWPLENGPFGHDGDRLCG